MYELLEVEVWTIWNTLHNAAFHSCATKYQLISVCWVASVELLINILHRSHILEMNERDKGLNFVADIYLSGWWFLSLAAMWLFFVRFFQLQFFLIVPSFNFTHLLSFRIILRYGFKFETCRYSSNGQYMCDYRKTILNFTDKVKGYSVDIFRDINLHLINSNFLKWRIIFFQSILLVISSELSRFFEYIQHILIRKHVILASNWRHRKQLLRLCLRFC